MKKNLTMETLMLCALALWLPAPLGAQEPAASITINGYGYGAIAGISHNCPLTDLGDGVQRLTGYVGDEVECSVWAVAANGAATPASIDVVPNDTTRVRITIESTPPPAEGETPNMATHMVVEILEAGDWTLTIEANPLLDVFGYMYERSDAAVWPRIERHGIDALVGEEFLLCAYELGGEGVPVAKSLERPLPCPDPEGWAGEPLPEFEVEWTLPDVLGPVEEATPRLLTSWLAGGWLRPVIKTPSRHAVPLRVAAAGR